MANINSETSVSAPPAISGTTPASPTRSIHYDVEAGHRDSSNHHSSDRRRILATRHSFRSQDDVVDSDPAPILKNRQTRASTSRSVRAANAYPNRPAWHPGQEPGLDTSKPNGGRTQTPTLHTDCEITVVDYSEDDMVMRRLNNTSLPTFLEGQAKMEEWVKCRWINVNGLSWDVISEIGKYKRLHRLAIEDMLNTRNRTKADWYSDHTYIILTLQKLVHMHFNEDGSDTSDSETDSSTSPNPRKRKAGRNRLNKWLHDIVWGPNSSPGGEEFMNGEVPDSMDGSVKAPSQGQKGARLRKLKTLQQYHGGPNVERGAFMEAHSPLRKKNLAVCAEQVSIFLASENTVISFFEASAEDIEAPILNRLSTPDTILRRSCDASMLMQAIIDAIIDLAIPVSTAYQDVIGNLELDVLTQPSIKHTKDLYIVTSEIATMRNFVHPVANLVAALRDHKAEPISSTILPDKTLSNQSGIKISPMARTYLGDVEDHCILITDALDQMHDSANGMIDLIFNTISAYQNESMKQLTIVTIVFLPMTFLAGYWGMNFTHFASLDNDESYFWSIAIPVAFATGAFLMKDKLARWFFRTVQRRGIMKSRKWRLRREAERQKTA